MRGIKIPQYEFALKMQGGLMREGGRICGTLRYLQVWVGSTNEIMMSLALIHLVHHTSFS